MKDWFPLTSYDFYAYIASGMIVIAGCDYFLTDGLLFYRAQWTLPQGAFWVVLCYLFGHVLAGPSHLIFEELVARKLFHAPSAIILGTATPRLREKIGRFVFSASDYAPFSAIELAAIRNKVESLLSSNTPVISALTSEQMYFVAYPYARSVPDSASRLDNFSALYGMSRNVCFSVLLVTLLAGCRAYGRPDAYNIGLAVSGVLFTIGLYGRFVKFYATYSKEVFRTFYKAAS